MKRTIYFKLKNFVFLLFVMVLTVASCLSVWAAGTAGGSYTIKDDDTVKAGVSVTRITTLADATTVAKNTYSVTIAAPKATGHPADLIGGHKIVFHRKKNDGSLKDSLTYENYNTHTAAGLDGNWSSKIIDNGVDYKKGIGRIIEPSGVTIYPTGSTVAGDSKVDKYDATSWREVTVTKKDKVTSTTYTKLRYDIRDNNTVTKSYPSDSLCFRYKKAVQYFPTSGGVEYYDLLVSPFGSNRGNLCLDSSTGILFRKSGEHYVGVGVAVVD